MSPRLSHLRQSLLARSESTEGAQRPSPRRSHRVMTERPSLEFTTMFDSFMSEEIQFPIDSTSVFSPGSNRPPEISQVDRSALEAATVRGREERRSTAQTEMAARRRERRRARRRSSNARNGAPMDASVMALTPVVGSDPSLEQLRFDLACTSFGLGAGTLVSGKAGGVVGAVVALVWGRRRWSSHR